jgi:hypothetical protein
MKSIADLPRQARRNSKKRSTQKRRDTQRAAHHRVGVLRRLRQRCAAIGRQLPLDHGGADEPGLAAKRRLPAELFQPRLQAHALLQQFGRLLQVTGETIPVSIQCKLLLRQDRLPRQARDTQGKYVSNRETLPLLPLARTV